MSTFKLQVVTPAGVAVEDSVKSVNLPTVDGEIGLLPGHIQYTGVVGVGVLAYVAAADSSVKRLVISGGFCQFNSDTLTVLADSCDLSDTIDKSSYGKEREELKRVLDVGDTRSAAWIVAREKLSRIEAIDALLAN